MMEHAGRAGPAGDRADARRDHHCGGVPAASVGSHLSALRRRDGGDPEPVLRPPSPSAAAAVVRGVRLERDPAPRPPPPHPPPGAAPAPSLVIGPTAPSSNDESHTHILITSNM